MGKIKKILENELVGGTQTTDVYPVTSVKAVYDENNERLDNIINRRGVVNISTNYNSDHIAEVLTLDQAIAKVPSKDRVLGFQGKFLTSSGWEYYIFTGETISNWSDKSKWSKYYTKEEIDKIQEEQDNKLTELKNETVGTIVTSNITSSHFEDNLMYNYKAGDKVKVHIETSPAITKYVLGNSTTPYEGGNNYPMVYVKDGIGEDVFVFTEDGELTSWGFYSYPGEDMTITYHLSNNQALGLRLNNLEEKTTDLESNVYTYKRTFDFSPENYQVDFSDFELKAGTEYILYAETNSKEINLILGSRGYNYINDEYYEDGSFPNIKIIDGQGFVKIKNDTDTVLGNWGFPSSSAAKTGTVNFIIYSGSLASLKQSIEEINDEINDIKGYKQVNSNILSLGSTVNQGDLQFQITANKKYLLKVDCSKPYNTIILGNPKLNYIDGKYYEDGLFPNIKIVNGQGSIIISNNTDANLSSWGFINTKTSAMYEGDYTFTLFKLSENSVNLMSLKQSIEEINIPPIAKSNGFIRIFHSMGVIGDSLSSGEIVTGSGTGDNPFKYNDRYNFSWLANIARKYGADWKCFSNGGQTAQGWLSRWLSDLTSEENKRSLYFIALGTNDEGLINKGQLVLGTKDSNSNEASFAGYYKKIIESVHAYSEHSIIMCCTTYGKQTVLSPINKLIQEISDLYDYCYFINTSQKSSFNLDSEYVRGGHFDTLGYVKLADALEVLVNDVLEENKSKLATLGVNAPN